MEKKESEEMICPLCNAVIDRLIADWIVILDGDCPSSCDDGALVRVRCPKCGFPIFGKTVDADYVTHHEREWPDWVEVVWNDEGDEEAKRALRGAYSPDRPYLWFCDGEFHFGFGKAIEGVWHSTSIRLIPADDIKEQSQRARSAFDSLVSALTWLEANPHVDTIFGSEQGSEQGSQLNAGFPCSLTNSVADLLST